MKTAETALPMRLPFSARTTFLVSLTGILFLAPHLAQAGPLPPTSGVMPAIPTLSAPSTTTTTTTTTAPAQVSNTTPSTMTAPVLPTTGSSAIGASVAPVLPGNVTTTTSSSVSPSGTGDMAPRAAMPTFSANPPGMMGRDGDEAMQDVDLPGKGEKDNKEKSEKKLNTLEDKVTGNVTDVVKRLGSTTENVTLDDLNSAKQAVAKIEALIDIEKHLNDLEKIRQERGGASAKALAPAIPISALTPPPSSTFPPFMAGGNMSAAVTPPAPPLTDIERIIGSNGRFTAFMKSSDGQSKPVHVGDKLGDGSTVVAITSKGVELDQNGSKRTVQVKNVGTVFGNTP